MHDGRAGNGPRQRMYENVEMQSLLKINVFLFCKYRAPVDEAVDAIFKHKDEFILDYDSI